MKKSLIISGMFLLVCSANAHADLLDAFANGGFEGGTMNTNSFNSKVPPGWTITGGTPDTFNGDTDFAGFTWDYSSTGGQFLHGIGWQPGYTESALQIGLGGLVIGQQYEISFEQAISRSTYSETSGYWQIKFGGESQNSTVMSIPAFGEFKGWEWQTMIFTATAETQTLEVIAMSITDGLRTDLGIDSFYLGSPGGNPNNPNNPVPEPTTLLLISLGLLSLAGVSKKKQR